MWGVFLLLLKWIFISFLELDVLIQSKMVKVETPSGMMWSCLDCGYVAKKANILEHIDAKASQSQLKKD